MATPKALLGMLFNKGLIPQAEVAVTQGIAWLCSTSEGSNPLASLIQEGGLTSGDAPRWLAEVVAQDRTRTDLECYWGSSEEPRVVVEAKLGHHLGVDQVQTYIRDLHSRVEANLAETLMVVLVPEHRRPEAQAVLTQAIQGEASTVRSAVWSYDEVLQALTAALGSSSDLEQLAGLIEVCEALDIKPFTAQEIEARSPQREPDLERILDQASAAVSDGQRLLPSRTQDPDLSWMRYVGVHPDGTCIGVGVRRPVDGQANGKGWASVRLHKDTYNPRGAGKLLEREFPGRTALSPNGATWMPLTLRPGLGGAAMHQELVGELMRIVAVLGPTPE